jgi:hypothetical protein
MSPKHHNRFHAFLGQNLHPVRVAATQAVDALLAARSAEYRTARSPSASRRLAFIEPSPYLADDMWAEDTAELHARGWTTYVAQRFQQGAGTIDAARADWAAPLPAAENPTGATL